MRPQQFRSEVDPQYDGEGLERVPLPPEGYALRCDRCLCF
jgi:hypothetical protein